MNVTISHEWLTPILAADVKTVISLIFVVIAFLSWLWSLINGDKNAPVAGQRPKPPQPRVRPREKDLQAEINKFLKNVMGQQQNEGEDILEVIEDAEPVRQKRPNRQGGPNRAAPLPSAEAETSRSGSRPGGHIAKRKGPGSTNLGSSVREHLAEHMQNRVVKQAQDHLAHGVAEKVQNDLGSFTAVAVSSGGTIPQPDRGRSAMTGASVGQWLRDPVGVKQAFVLNLILNRRSLHRNRDADFGGGR